MGHYLPHILKAGWQAGGWRPAPGEAWKSIPNKFLQRSIFVRIN
jgi:hypothetical protein